MKTTPSWAKLFRRNAKRKCGRGDIFNPVVLRAIDFIRPAAQREELIHAHFVRPRQGEKNIARCPGEVERSLAVERKIGIPILLGSEFLPALDLFQLFKASERPVRRLVTRFVFGAIEPHEIIGIDPVEQGINHPVAFIQVDTFDLQVFS